MQTGVENIIHEAEVQRQHVRVHFPAKAMIDGSEYEISDLSPNGICICNFKLKNDNIKTVKITIFLPFSGFNLDIDLEGEIRHYSKETNKLGAQFIKMSADQSAVLKNILRSFIAGDIIGSGDIINVIARENFVKIRNDNNAPTARATWKRQILPLGIIAALGFIAFFIILSNVYSNFFVLHINQASVDSAKINMRSPVNGIYESLIDPDVKIIKKGQDLARVTASDDYNSPVSQEKVPSKELVLKSPCDCVILSNSVVNGEYIISGSSVLTLVQADVKPSVTAKLASKDAKRISLGDKATIMIIGSDLEFKGTVVNFKPNNLDYTPVSAEGEEYDAGIKVILSPDQELPVDFIGRPATVDFKL